MIYTSPHDDLPIPEDKALWSYLELHAGTESARKPAFICSATSREVSYLQVFTQAKQIAAGLHAKGVKKGDVVILHSFNCVEYPIAFFALNRLGAICSPSSPMFNAHELGDQIDVAKASTNETPIAQHCVRKQSSRTRHSLKSLLTPRNTVGSRRARCTRWEKRQDRSHRNQSSGFSRANVYADMGALAYVLIVEATFRHNWSPEGSPLDLFAAYVDSTANSLSCVHVCASMQGVEITVRALLASAIDFSYLDHPGPLTLGLAPFFHIMGTLILHSCIYKGSAIVVLPRFQPDTFLSSIEKYKLEQIIVAPPVMLFLAQHPLVEKYDLTHLKVIGCGGAPLGAEIENLAQKRLNVTVMQGYGMTELSGAGTYSPPETKRLGSTGKIVPNARMKVMSLTTGADLPPNEVGELLFHTPQLMRGYFNNPDANRAAFDEDGFLRTGDIGYIDDDGFVFIVDRIKELIKYKGHQVAPAELEDVLNNHPSVADSCCVRGLDHTTGEEIPKAYVVLKPGTTSVSSEDVMAFVQTKVAPYKFVRELEFIDVIPKSLSGKILRRELQVKENEKIAAIRKQLQSRL